MRYSLFVALCIFLSPLFSNNCEPEKLFQEVDCPSNICSKRDFEYWEKNKWGPCSDKYYHGSVEVVNIEASNSVEKAKEHLLRNISSYIAIRTERKTIETVTGNDGTFKDDYKNEVSSSSSANIRNIKILHKKMANENYITNVYKYKDDFDDEINEYDKDLYEKAETNFSDYKESLKNGDFSKAYQYLSYSYLCISNRFKRHNLSTEIEQELKAFLNKIEIKFNPESIKNIPVYVDNNKTMSVTATYDNKKLADFEFEASSETGIGNWPNNKKIEMTNGNGKFEIKIGNIITTTKKQSIMVTPRIWRFDESKQTFWEDNFSVAKEIKDNSIKELETIISSYMEGFDLYVNDKPLLSISFKKDESHTNKNKFKQQELYNQFEKKIPGILKQFSDEKFRYGKCTDDECINILINYSLLSSIDNSNKDFKLEMHLDDYGTLSRFSELEITLDKNLSLLGEKDKRSIRNSMKKLHEKLFFSEITYDLKPGVQLILDKLEKPLENSGIQLVPKGKVNLKFQYSHSAKRKMTIYETDFIISNSFEVNDKFKEQSAWDPDNHLISYKFYKDWRWDKKSIQWDPISFFSSKDNWDPKKNFESCPNYICTGKSTKEHILLIIENGYFPIRKKIDLLDLYEPEQRINLEEAKRIKGNMLNYIIPGYGFYSIPSPNPLAKKPMTYGFYQNDPLHNWRGVLYTLLTALSINQALAENSKFKNASETFETAKEAYMGLDPESPESEYDYYYDAMKEAQISQQRHQNNFYASAGAVAVLYGINFIEVSILFGSGK